MALALVIAGVVAFFAAVASLLAPLTRSANALMEETRRTGILASLPDQPGNHRVSRSPPNFG